MKINGKHILRTFGWIIFALFLVIIGIGGLLYFKAESYINHNLSEFVAKKSDNKYQLSFDNIEFNYKPFSISVSNISLKPNQQITQEILQKEPDKIFYSFHSPELKLTKLRIVQFIKNKNFFCKSITVTEPEFTVSGKGNSQNNSTKYMDKIFVEFRPLFLKQIKKIKIDEIHFVDANYKLYHSLINDKQISNAQKISIEIKKFRTDSAIIFRDPHFFESDDILISINQFQNNLSDSTHILNIDKLEYSLKTTDIFAHGFHLTHKGKNAQKNLYDVQVPKLQLKSKSIAGLSLNDSVEIQYVKFENPQILFYQKENQKEIGIEDINQFNLYSLVETQFTKIKIDSFVLTNANLKIFQQPDTGNYQQHFKLLNITLNGFDLDSTSAKNKSKIFHADNLEMSVNGYHLKLIDNQHEFNADSLFVSTKSSSLGIKNILIAPLDRTDKKSRTSVNVNCQDLEIDQVNFKTLFHTRTLPTRRISVTNPEVQVQYHSEIPLAKEKKELGLLYNLVSAYLKGVYSEVVEVKNGALNIQTLNNTLLEGYFETNFNFNLSGFALDSASMQQTDKFFYATNFDLQFSDYQMKLVDNLHKINVDKISIQSFDRKLLIENLQLNPVVDNADRTIMQSFNRSELYNITIPKITLRGINLRDAFFYNKLNIVSFHVTKPNIYFENFGILRKKKEETDFSELYQLISNYISDFNIKEITVPEGNFTWVNHTKKAKTTTFDNEFSATLKGFRLNQNELDKQRLFFSDNFDISVKDQIFQLSDNVHILQAGKINLSSETSSIRIENALLYPLVSSNKQKNLPTTFQVSIPELQINNFDFLKAYKSKELRLSTIELNEPKIKVYSKKGISKSLDLNRFDFPLPSFVESFELNEFKINNGEVITYETDDTKQKTQSYFKINLSLPDVSLKKNINNRAKISTGNLTVNLFGFNANLGKNHELKIENLDFNRNRKTISISQLKVNAFGLKHHENRFSISAPQIHFSGFDIENAINNNHFEFNEINITNPQIGIEVNDSIKGDKLEFAKNLDLFPIVEPYVNKIKVNLLQLQKVDLNFNWFKKELINKQFNLNFKEIDISENAKRKNLLNSEEFEISTTKLSTQSKNGLYVFTADSLIYNSAKHNALLKNIKVTPLLTKDEFHETVEFQTDYVQTSTDYIELKEVDENYWLQENILDARALVIGPSQINIYRNKRLLFNTKQRPPWPQDLLKEIEQSFVFDSLFVLPSLLKYNELLDISEEPGHIEFNELAIKTGKISNITKEIQQKPNLEINASAKLFNQGLLSINFNFDLIPNSYFHTLTGSMQPMSLVSLNTMIEKSAPISIQSGELTRFDFDLSFTEHNASGTLYLGYDNFKISVLEQKDSETKKLKLATFWANRMVLNSKNPKGDVFLPTTINYQKDNQRSIINYWWKTLFTGTKETIGLKSEKNE